MKVDYVINEIITYKVTRVFDDETVGGIESYGVFDSLKNAERTAQRLSEAEPCASSWRTVSKSE